MRFSMPEPVLRELSFIDRKAAGQISFPDHVVSNSDRDHYIVSSLIEEAINPVNLRVPQQRVLLPRPCYAKEGPPRSQ